MLKRPVPCRHLCFPNLRTGTDLGQTQGSSGTRPRQPENVLFFCMLGPARPACSGQTLTRLRGLPPTLLSSRPCSPQQPTSCFVGLSGEGGRARLSHISRVGVQSAGEIQTPALSPSAALSPNPLNSAGVQPLANLQACKPSQLAPGHLPPHSDPGSGSGNPRARDGSRKLAPAGQGS